MATKLLFVSVFYHQHVFCDLYKTEFIRLEENAIWNVCRGLGVYEKGLLEIGAKSIQLMCSPCRHGIRMGSPLETVERCFSFGMNYTKPPSISHLGKMGECNNTENKAVYISCFSFFFWTVRAGWPGREHTAEAFLFQWIRKYKHGKFQTGCLFFLAAFLLSFGIHCFVRLFQP